MGYGVFTNRVNDSLLGNDGIYFSKVGGFIMPNIYISPSPQEHNAGVGPFGTEEFEMNGIADILIHLIAEDERFVWRRNSPAMDIYQIATDSNTWGADLHIAIHSNAGGGEGTEVYAYGPNTNSEKLAKALYAQIAPLSPGADRGVKFNSRLYEVGNNVNATSALIELAFHDNAIDAKWIAYNHEMIAQALYKAVCDYFSYEYRALTVAPVIVPSTPLKVDNTDKAIALLNQAIALLK